MWTDEKQKQFDALREKEFAGTLAKEEQQQLEQFLVELDAEEAKLLRPAMKRMDAEIQQKQAEIARLEKENALRAAIVKQQEQLLQRARAILQEFQNDKERLPSKTVLLELQSEDERLRSEYEHLMFEGISAT